MVKPKNRLIHSSWLVTVPQKLRVNYIDLYMENQTGWNRTFLRKLLINTIVYIVCLEVWTDFLFGCLVRVFIKLINDNERGGRKLLKHICFPFTLLDEGLRIFAIINICDVFHRTKLISCKLIVVSKSYCYITLK